MESHLLKKVQFMPQSKYKELSEQSAISKENLYLVEFRPDFNFFPDYNASIDLMHNTEYTVGSGVLPNSGWYRIGLTSRSSHGQSPQLTTTINGQKFFINYACAFTMVFLTEGDTFSYRDERNGSYWSNVNAKFFPVREN